MGDTPQTNLANRTSRQVFVDKIASASALHDWRTAWSLREEDLKLELPGEPEPHAHVWAYVRFLETRALTGARLCSFEMLHPMLQRQVDPKRFQSEETARLAVRVIPGSPAILVPARDTCGDR